MSLTQISARIRANLKIPTIPEVVHRIMKLTQDPNVGTGEIGQAIAQDPEMSAKLLKVANSAFYGLRTPCLSAEHASTVLGMRVLKSIVSQVAVMDMFDSVEGGSAFDVRDLWEHSIRTGHVASFLHRKSTAPSEIESDELYMCGLLHDIGKMVLLDQMKGEYLEVVEASMKANIPSYRLEQDRFGFTHTEVGGVLGSHWNLPEVVVDAITRHHMDRREIVEMPVTVTVACADQLVRCVENEQWPACYAIFDGDVKRLLGLSDGSVEEIITFAKELEVEL